MTAATEKALPKGSGEGLVTSYPSLGRVALRALALAGTLVAAGQVLVWSRMGAWPFHDTAAFWLAGTHLRDGAPVYTAGASGFLAFLYAPPWAVGWAVVSLLPLELVCVALFAAQILALRYIGGSWLVAGLFCWLPFVPRELVTGNVDLVMAAAILAAIRGVRGSGAFAAVFALAKFSPALAVRRWLEFGLAIAVGVALTLPWLSLWPEWIASLARSSGSTEQWLPLLPRVPLVLGLLALRRPWSIAAAAGLATPAFYFHSLVLLLPALRLGLGSPEPVDDVLLVRAALGLPEAHRDPPDGRRR